MELRGRYLGLAELGVEELQVLRSAEAALTRFQQAGGLDAPTDLRDWRTWFALAAELLLLMQSVRAAVASASRETGASVSLVFSIWFAMTFATHVLCVWNMREGWMSRLFAELCDGEEQWRQLARALRVLHPAVIGITLFNLAIVLLGMMLPVHDVEQVMAVVIFPLPDHLAVKFFFALSTFFPAVAWLVPIAVFWAAVSVIPGLFFSLAREASEGKLTFHDINERHKAACRKISLINVVFSKYLMVLGVFNTLLLVFLLYRVCFVHVSSFLTFAEAFWLVAVSVKRARVARIDRSTGSPPCRRPLPCTP
jgi:hypothetical protein